MLKRLLPTSPRSVTFKYTITSLQSAPDGSALLVFYADDLGRSGCRVFHTASFGARGDGFELQVPDPNRFGTSSSFSVTSLGKRSAISVLSLNPSTLDLCSTRVTIANTARAYALGAKQAQSRNSEKSTEHNSLIECFAEIWTKYPVVPAIEL